MSILRLKCDGCGVSMAVEDAASRYHRDLCKECHLKEEISFVEDSIARKEQEIARSVAELKELQADLAELKLGENPTPRPNWCRNCSAIRIRVDDRWICPSCGVGVPSGPQ